MVQVWNSRALWWLQILESILSRSRFLPEGRENSVLDELFQPESGKPSVRAEKFLTNRQKTGLRAEHRDYRSYESEIHEGMLYIRDDDQHRAPFGEPPVVCNYFSHEEITKSAKKKISGKSGFAELFYCGFVERWF